VTVLTDTDRLGLMLANTAEPILDADAMETLLAESKIRDQNGRWTDDPQYVLTYDLNRAAGRGWRIKAGRVAADYDLKLEGRELSRAQMIEHFLTMAKEYEKKAGVRSVTLRDPGVNELWSR
jgi:hypothetical protein